MMDLTVSLKLELKPTRTIRTIYLEVSLSCRWSTILGKLQVSDITKNTHTQKPSAFSSFVLGQ